MADVTGSYFIPAVTVFVGILLLMSRKDLFSEFLIGARDGLRTCTELLPTLVILVTAVKMLSASGAVEAISSMVAKPFGVLGIPQEILPTLLVRPISGSAATATVKQLFDEYGPDSFAGRCASIIMGSSDTILYTLAMYFGAVKVKKTRHALPAAFLTLGFCAIFSAFLARIFFGGN